MLTFPPFTSTRIDVEVKFRFNPNHWYDEIYALRYRRINGVSNAYIAPLCVRKKRDWYASLLNISFAWQKGRHLQPLPWILQIQDYSRALQRTAERRRRLRRGVIHFPSTLYRSNGPSYGSSKLLQGVSVALCCRSSVGARSAWRRFHEDFRTSFKPTWQGDIDIFRLYTTPRRHSDLSRDPKAREYTVYLDSPETTWRR